MLLLDWVAISFTTMTGLDSSNDNALTASSVSTRNLNTRHSIHFATDGNLLLNGGHSRVIHLFSRVVKIFDFRVRVTD